MQIEHFELFFVPELLKLGYSGIHRPKSRYNTMHEEDKRFVDGCCIFWKNQRFDLHFDHLIDFVEQTMARDSLLADHDAFSRLISKDNIGLVAVLEIKTPGSAPKTNSMGAQFGGSQHFPSIHDIRASPQRNRSRDVLLEQYNPGSKYLMVCNTHIHWVSHVDDG